MLKLNIGCGNNILDGYVNIDVRKTNKDVVVADAQNLPYENGSVDEILAKGVYEHISFRQSKALLQHWVSKLKEGGELTIITPSLQGVMDLARTEHQIRSMYGADVKGLERIIKVIFGGQDYPENKHCTIGHPVLLKRYLCDAGVKGNISIVTGIGNTTNMKVVATK